MVLQDISFKFCLCESEKVHSLNDLICKFCEKILLEKNDTVMGIGSGYHSYMLNIKKKCERKVRMYIYMYIYVYIRIYTLYVYINM